MRSGSPPRGRRLPARGFLGAQRPALFPWLCFKYLTTIPPSLRQIPGLDCRLGTRAHCGAERGAKGAGGACPLGTLLFRRVDSAIWVTRAGSWGCLIVFFFPSPRSKNCKMGTLGMNRTVSKAVLGRGAGVTAQHKQNAVQPKRLGRPPEREPARPDAGFLICPSLYIFRKYQSLTHFATRGIPAQTNPNGVKQEILPSPKFGAQETLRKGQHHGHSAPTAFRSHLVLGMAPWGSHTSPGMAPPSQGNERKMEK